MYVEHVFAIGILKPDLSDTRHNDNTIKRSRRPRTPNPPSATSTTAPNPVEINADLRVMPTSDRDGLTGGVDGLRLSA